MQSEQKANSTRGKRKRANTFTDGLALGTAVGDFVGAEDGDALGSADGCLLCGKVVVTIVI